MIYYSHVNEDTRPERSGLNNGQFQDLCCIAGSGERLIALLDNDFVERVFVIDQNDEALYLTQLKLTALSTLDVDDYLSFVGHQVAQLQYRDALYQQLRASLPAPTRTYWDRNTAVIQKGVLNCGHFERFLDRTRAVNKWFLGSRFFECFQEDEYDMHWSTLSRWHLLKALFNQRWTYRLLGNRDVAFVSTDANLRRITNALQDNLDTRSANQSFIFHLVFKGHLREMNPEHLPPSLDHRILQKIKDRLGNNTIEIQWGHADLKEYWERDSTWGGRSCFYSLSDLVSFVSMDYLYDLLDVIRERSRAPATCFTRSFLRRTMSELDPLRLQNWINSDVSDQDSSGMYEVIRLELP